jgi:hypothetical protein
MCSLSSAIEHKSAHILNQTHMHSFSVLVNRTQRLRKNASCQKKARKKTCSHYLLQSSAAAFFVYPWVTRRETAWRLPTEKKHVGIVFCNRTYLHSCSRGTAKVPSARRKRDHNHYMILPLQLLLPLPVPLLFFFFVACANGRGSKHPGNQPYCFRNPP